MIHKKIKVCLHLSIMASVIEACRFLTLILSCSSIWFPPTRSDAEQGKWCRTILANCMLRYHKVCM
jgi:hypothetical protein